MLMRPAQPVSLLEQLLLMKATVRPSKNWRMVKALFGMALSGFWAFMRTLFEVLHQLLQELTSTGVPPKQILTQEKKLRLYVRVRARKASGKAPAQRRLGLGAL